MSFLYEIAKLGKKIKIAHKINMKIPSEQIKKATGLTDEELENKIVKVNIKKAEVEYVIG